MNTYIDFWNKENTSRITNKKLLIDGIELIIDPHVFDPDPNITYSTSLILDNFPNVKNKKVLDVGCGSGVLLVKSIYNNAKICLGVDIDLKALKNSYNNTLINNTNNKTILIWSDHFSTVYDKFDIIFANLPIIDDDSEVRLSEFLHSYDNYLTENGRLYVTYASFGEIFNPHEFFKQRGSIDKIYTKKKLGVDWYLFVLGKCV